MAAIYRRIRFKAARTGLFRDPLIWLRHRGLHPEDVFLASYPRSGQFWLRFQLIEILTGKSGEFDTIDTVIPKVGLHRSVKPVLPGGGRLIQTHEKYRNDYKKAIYLVRDFRDVVTSEFLQARAARFPMYIDDLDTYLLACLRGKVQGFGSWNDHVLSWIDSPLASEQRVLIVRFEDMRRDAAETMMRVVRFLNVPVDCQAVLNAVSNNSLERMRAKEDRRVKYHTSKEEDRHVHGGSAGGWREKLTRKQVELIEQYAGKALSRLGYPLTVEQVSTMSGEAKQKTKIAYQA